MKGRLLPALAIALLTCGIIAVVVHYAEVTSDLAARVGSVAPFLIVLGLAGLIVALVTRRPLLIGAGAVIAIAGVFTQLPLYVGSTSGDADLTVMQANIYLGGADVDVLAATVAERDVDVLTVAELTDHALAAIRASSIGMQLPYSVVEPAAEGGGGTGLFSRHRLSGGERLPGFRMANLRAVAEVPGHGEVVVYAVHPLPPWPEPAWRWTQEMAVLGESIATEQLPVIISGDFNSTYDHAQLRRLLRGGLRDAAEQTGAGIVATYPANRSIPALIAIDRIVTGAGARAVWFERVPLPGSDHHGVIAGIAL